MKIKKILIFSLLFLLCFYSWIPKDYVYSENHVYSNVYDDLKKDPNFSLNDYQVIDTDFSLKVIDIAESNEQDLFIYVYQACSPNNDLLATSINLSTSNGVYFNNYPLEFINYCSTLYKYKVQNFKISNSTERIYSISSIFRKWNSQYDSSSGNDNTISEVAFAVGKQYEFNNQTKTCKDIELVNIESKYVGFVRYINAEPRTFALYGGWTTTDYDRHFIAFSSDKKIDKLISADVYYKTQSYAKDKTSETYGNIETKSKTLNYENKVEVGTNSQFLWIKSYSYSWNEIETTSDFVNNLKSTSFSVYNGLLFNTSNETKLSQNAINGLDNKSWVLNFEYTPYFSETHTYRLISGSISYTEIQKTIVSDISILRMEFETDGVYYNLGVVDNKQTGICDPINKIESTYQLTAVGKIAAFLIVLMLFLIIYPILKAVFKVLSIPFVVYNKITKKHQSKNHNDCEITLKNKFSKKLIISSTNNLKGTTNIDKKVA